MRPFIATLGLSALVLTGCASQVSDTPEDPVKALRAAAENLEKYQAVEMKVSLDGSPEVWLEALGQDSMKKEDVDKLLNSSIVLKNDTGEDKDSTADDTFFMGVVVDKKEAINMTGGPEVVYVKIAFDDLSTTFPSIASDVDQLRSSISSVPELSSIEPLFNDEWIGLDISPDSDLRQMLEEAGIGTEVAGVADVNKIKEAFSEVLSVSKVTRDSKDGNRINATVNAQDAYAKLEPIFNTEGQSAAITDLTGETLPDASDVPDKDISVSMWIKDSKFERIEIDLSQFDDRTPKGTILRVDISEIDGVELPSGVQMADLSMLLGGM